MGNPYIHSKIAPTLSSAVHIVLCSDNSCRLAGNRRSTSSQTPSSSGHSSSPGSWHTSYSSFHRERLVLHSWIIQQHYTGLEATDISSIRINLHQRWSEQVVQSRVTHNRNISTPPVHREIQGKWVGSLLASRVS